ncbi:ABC transporter ATP-binding protein [Stackebrandtia soli]|uniref:ABC transporter ATP-binding protein n=1 Tax=Stackebrandtia soli TaxID=1892856 RepID=UPI0039E801DD
MTSALRADGLRKSVRLPDGSTLPILRGVDLSVDTNECVAVIGRSGSGKSTLLTMLGLLARPDEGSLAISDTDTTALSDAERSRLRNVHLGFIFQNYSLLPHLTAAENVELPLMQGSRVGKRAARAAVATSLAAVGLGDRQDARPRQLSGGEQQRVAIARALVRSPRLILADEPTGALDEETAETVLDILQRTVRDRGTTLLLVTHDSRIAARADRVLTLEHGRIRDGSSE